MLRPIPAWRLTLAAVAVFAVTAVGVTIWLLTIAGHAKSGTDRANASLDAVRTGLAAGAGAGAAVGLMLAFRRQHHQEIATVLTDLDATERRITELYTKAVEQLGNDKAPVRLGGLYALERLAQDNPAHRQTIVNVICAYLRMPFPSNLPLTEEAIREADLEAEGYPGPFPDPPFGSVTDREAWEQERQVRLTAQRILGEHLRDDRAKDQRSTDPPSTRLWPGIRLDLTGATLIGFDLGNGVVAEADFRGATFTGDAFFDLVTFTGKAHFSGATFNGSTAFDGATFSGNAFFDKVTFTGPAAFSRATFTPVAWFSEATFTGDAFFDKVTFTGPAAFSRATFTGVAWFSEATFTGNFFVSFKRSRVLSPGEAHTWPPGWRLGQGESGEHTVVRANGGQDEDDTA